MSEAPTPREDVVERIADILATTEYFTTLPGDARRALARHTSTHTYDAGEVAFLEGDLCAGLYLVLEGWLKAIRTSTEGREQVLRILGPGDAFNVVGVLADTANPATVIALEPARVGIIRRDVMASLVREHPDISQAVIRSLAQRVLELVSMVEDLSLHSVETRLARLLLETAREGIVYRHRWTTQAEIAARLGTVLAVLNRALRGLADEGIIAVERKRIVILDRERLMAKAFAAS